jgi:hypothetical protein
VISEQSAIIRHDNLCLQHTPTFFSFLGGMRLTRYELGFPYFGPLSGRNRSRDHLPEW